VTARERARRLAVLEAAVAKRAEAEAASPYSAILEAMTREQLRALLDLVDESNAGLLTEAESLARFAATPGPGRAIRMDAVTGRNRDRRLLALEATAAVRAKAEADAAVNEALDDLLGHLSRDQLRQAIHLGRSVRDGALTMAEAMAGLRADPDFAQAMGWRP